MWHDLTRLVHNSIASGCRAPEGDMGWTNEVIIPINYPALRMQEPGPLGAGPLTLSGICSGDLGSYCTRRITSNGVERDTSLLYMIGTFFPSPLSMSMSLPPPLRSGHRLPSLAPRADRSIDDFILQPGYNLSLVLRPFGPLPRAPLFSPPTASPLPCTVTLLWLWLFFLWSQDNFRGWVLFPPKEMPSCGPAAATRRTRANGHPLIQQILRPRATVGLVEEDAFKRWEGGGQRITTPSPMRSKTESVS